jgi:hypothetical protein
MVNQGASLALSVFPSLQEQRQLSCPARTQPCMCAGAPLAAQPDAVGLIQRVPVIPYQAMTQTRINLLYVKRRRLAPDMIRPTAWLQFRVTSSFQDFEEVLVQRVQQSKLRDHPVLDVQDRSADHRQT